MFTILLAVIIWQPISISHCDPREPAPACVLRAKQAFNQCTSDRRADCSKERCWKTVTFCDRTYLGLQDDGTVTWKIQTSTESRQEAYEAIGLTIGDRQ